MREKRKFVLQQAIAIALVTTMGGVSAFAVSMAIGTGTDSGIFGNKSSTASSTGSYVIGNDSNSAATGTMVVGNNSNVTGNNAIVVGNNATATGTLNAVAIGTGSTAQQLSISIGESAGSGNTNTIGFYGQHWPLGR